MNLYEIANQFQQVLNETFDHETGEVNEGAVARLHELEVKVEDKAIAVASYIKNLDAERYAIEQAKKAMQERESALQRRVDWLTSYLQSNMTNLGITEIKCPYFGIKLKKCPVSTDIQDESLIPEEYKKRKEIVTVDKVKIKEELQAGVVIPGAALKTNTRLEIK